MVTPLIARPREPDANVGPWFVDLDPYASSGSSNWGNGDGVPFGAALDLYGSFNVSANAQGAAKWWYVDLGSGLYDICLLHVQGNDIGIYSVCVDDVPVGTVDGYHASDVLDVRNTITGVPIGAGRHKIGLVMASKNASSSGYFAAIQHVFLRRTQTLPQRTGTRGLGALAQPMHRIVDIIPLMATGNTSWDGITVANHPEGTTIDTFAGGLGASRWWDVYLPAGAWDCRVLYDTNTSFGIFSVQLDGATQGQVDGYAAVAAQGLTSTVRVNVPSSGVHRLAVKITGFNGSSSNTFGQLRHISLEQVRGRPATDQRLIPWLVNFGLYFSHGNTTWDTTFSGLSTIIFAGDLETPDTVVGHARWWYLQLPAGTWDIELAHKTGTNRGIYSVQVDDVQVGTIDGYAGSGAIARSVVSGVAVAQGGRHKVALVINAKNGSSSGYGGTASALQLRRTA